MYLSLGISALLMLLIAAIGTCTSFDFTRHFCVIALSLLGLFFCSLMVCMVSSFIGAPPLWMTLSKAAMGVTVVMLVMEWRKGGKEIRKGGLNCAIKC